MDRDGNPESYNCRTTYDVDKLKMISMRSLLTRKHTEAMIMERQMKIQQQRQKLARCGGVVSPFRPAYKQGFQNELP